MEGVIEGAMEGAMEGDEGCVGALWGALRHGRESAWGALERNGGVSVDLGVGPE
ncbi:hypothetical protein TRAPUB_11903 [Trametes pubescens]|uniref:Uncharacterized protein n=1 Tax=Trametes pubescens TaxID=154538 RepID=A0A1M2V4S0_TRAPU|nr:hypothetical protein TRAPUB_6890 [Trametes pubescens]OJT11578.1 hypothetical protein TRAPUB_11903 [Trametes pubescens]